MENPLQHYHQLLLLLLLHPLLLLLLPVYGTNITLGSHLTAGNDINDSWASPSGDFAFGFREITTGGFLLAIWFDKIPGKTVVWSANGGNLAPRGSRIELTRDGELVLNDPNGKEVWTADSAGTGSVSYATMLDTGNFVLASLKSSHLWESFDHPTDTILPTQRLNHGSNLVARFSETNFSSGRFMCSMHNDGNLRLYTTNFPQQTTLFSYWSAGTGGSGFQVIFNQSGGVYLIAENGTILNHLLPKDVSKGAEGFYQRAILEYDGVLRQYTYPKSASAATAAGTTMVWSSSSQFIPENICISMGSFETVGSGACGFNSYCRMGDDRRPSCYCPPRYTLLDPLDSWGGCRPDFEQQRCDGGEKEAELFEFSNMLKGVDWPYEDYRNYKSVTREWCREECLADCFCGLTLFRDGECWIKAIPLRNGMYDPDNRLEGMVKVRKGNSTASPPFDHEDVGSKGKDQSGLILTGSALLGSSAFVNLLFLLSLLVFIHHCCKNRKTGFRRASPAMAGTNLRSFTYKELEEATNGFRDELGRGAFATVYKGALNINDNSGNNILIAVKKIVRMEKDGEKEFEVELKAIGRINHKNLVQLLGFCNDGENRLLVYELMKNGSLATFLFKDSKPDWCTRTQIILGTARGLLYLHEECSSQIIHCDIKPQNILLDEFYTARISDFGLAKLLMNDQTRTMTGIRGTKGYVAPEWFRAAPVTTKVDVYSFGVVLLEIIFCRRNCELHVDDESQIILADWVYDCYKVGELDTILQSDKEASNDIETLRKFVMIAFWCIQEDPFKRPTMKTVIRMLEGALEVSAPPEPSSFISSFCLSSTPGSNGV